MDDLFKAIAAVFAYLAGVTDPKSAAGRMHLREYGLLKRAVLYARESISCWEMAAAEKVPSKQVVYKRRALHYRQKFEEMLARE